MGCLYCLDTIFKLSKDPLQPDIIREVQLDLGLKKKGTTKKDILGIMQRIGANWMLDHPEKFNKFFFCFLVG